MNNSLAGSVQRGFFEGVCRECPYNGKTVDGRICARTVVETLVSVGTARSPKLAGANIDGTRIEFEARADECAKVLLTAVLDEPEQPVEPVQTYDMADVAVALMRNSGK